MFYLESPNLVYNPYVSPIYADSFDHLPPILIQSGGCEALRDEINELTAKIKGSKGTNVRHEIYEVILSKKPFSIVYINKVYSI